MKIWFGFVSIIFPFASIVDTEKDLVYLTVGGFINPEVIWNLTTIPLDNVFVNIFCKVIVFPDIIIVGLLEID